VTSIHQLGNGTTSGYLLLTSANEVAEVLLTGVRLYVRYAAFTPAQLVARNKHHVARSKLLVARNKLRVARNMLLQATSCAQLVALV